MIEWESEEWLGSVRALIAWTATLDINLPVALVIRHSHRTTIADYKEMVTGGLTETGRIASYEMGRRLPNNRTARLYTSIVPRSAETTEYIAKGIIDVGGTVSDIEPVALLMGPEYSDESVWTNLQPDGANVTEFVNRWSDDQFGDDIEPFWEFFSRIFAHVVEPLLTQNSTLMYIHVTHDLALMTLKRGLLRRHLTVEDREPYLGGIGLTNMGSHILVFEGNRQASLSIRLDQLSEYCSLNRR